MLDNKSSARKWIGTLNNPEVTAQEYLERWVTQGKAQYVCGQLEKGEQGTVHIQFTLSFKNETRLSALKKCCARAHFQQVKKDNGVDAYCMKEETRLEGPWEYGVKPVQRNSKTDWEEVWTKAAQGKIMEIPADIRLKHVFQIQQVSKINMVIPQRTFPKQCYWLYGPPGTGKTRLATETFPTAYKKLQNKWWDSYQSHRQVIMDDLGQETSKALTTHLKLWADPWQNHPGETKGGQVALTYDCFVITSNYHPSELFAGVDLEAVTRRFKVIDFTPAPGFVPPTASDLQGPCSDQNGDNH